MLLEVCIDSVVSAVNAQDGGARRLELCSSLSEGGLTPTVGMLKVVKQVVSVPVFVMVRPRAGDFLYTGQEIAVMKEDTRGLKEAGADGFVFGALTSDGYVDMEACQELIAIDMAQDITEALEQVIKLGCERVLTSGGESTSLEGAPIIRRMVEQAAGRTIVMPGGGITERNVARIIEETGCRELHASARSQRQSAMTYRNANVSMGAKFGPSEYVNKVTDKDMVHRLLQTSKQAA